VPLRKLVLGLSLACLASAGSLAAYPVRVLSDVPYLPPGRAEKLDIYLPDSPGLGLRPGVVYFHGGGWGLAKVHEDKADAREKEIGGVLAGAGYVFVSADFRQGRHCWPTILEDSRDAVRFLRAHAAEYQVDPNRIAVMGTSTGAHQALLVAFTDVGDRGPAGGMYAGVSGAVAAVVDLYGITDLLTRENVEPDGTPLGTLYDGHNAEMLGVGRSEGAALWREASPVFHVTASSPPVLIIQGTSDATVDYGQSIELDKVLRAKGVPHQMLLVKGVGHQFTLETWKGRPLPIDLRPVVLGFLDKYLRAKANP